MLTIRDAVWLIVLAVVGSLWYADRQVLADSLKHSREALIRERARADLMHEKLRQGSLKSRANGYE
jgi:hypothetical protein